MHDKSRETRLSCVTSTGNRWWWRVESTVFFMVIATAGTVQSQNTTSALDILNEAPKVRIPDPTPALVAPPPSYPQAVPYTPAPYNAAPPITPHYPAFTPYGGQSAQPSVPNYARPTPTPRPVLSPEDVGRSGPEPQRRGFFRSMINAIPFVGEDETDARFTPVPTRPAEPPIYRGYEPNATAPDGGPLLLPPGATPITRDFPADPTPSSPPIMTPTPRAGFTDDAVDLDSAAPTPANNLLQPGDITRPGLSPALTIRQEDDEPTTVSRPLYPVNDDTTTPGTPESSDEKRPAISRDSADTPAPTPRTVPPIDVRTTSILIQESRPVESTPAPATDLDADTLSTDQENAADTTPAPEITPAPTPVESDILTSLTIEQSDLGMPNPAYEENTSILAEFQTAVRSARAENHDEAARLFRDYALNHPSSGLAPRAMFLAIVFEKDRRQGREDFATMKKLFPDTHYIKRVEARRPDVTRDPAVAAAASGDPLATGTENLAGESAPPNETPRQRVDRLERELTTVVGDPTREPALRRQLGEAYLNLEEYDRAWEVLSPAAAMAAGTPDEGPVKALLVRSHMARGQVTQALALLDELEQKFPDQIGGTAASSWSAGLAYEAGMRFAKARTIYHDLQRKWPDSQEARWANLRLQQLATLAR